MEPNNDEIFNQNKHLHRLIFPTDDRYKDDCDYEKKSDVPQIGWDSLRAHNNEFEKWEFLPSNIQSMIVKKMNFVTRFSLMLTSKNNYQLVQSAPTMIDYILVTKNKAHKFKKHICIFIPSECSLQLLFFKRGGNTLVVRQWINTNTKKHVKKTKLWKKCDYIKQSELFFEKLLGLANYQVNKLLIEYLDFGVSLKIFDKVEVKKHLRLLTSSGSGTIRMLKCASSPLSELFIEIKDPFRLLNFWTDNSIKYAKRLTVVAKTSMPDSFLLDLDAAKLCTVGISVSDVTINTFIKRWIDGIGLHQFISFEIQKPRNGSNCAILRDIDFLEWDEQFIKENKTLNDYVKKFSRSMEHYYIESEARNNGATLIIDRNAVLFLVTGKRWMEPPEQLNL